jgi:SAM-dependent methyltransferase
VADRPIGDVAPDGSPVEVYRRLPAGREPGIIHAAVRAGATLLELGCGTGRVTAALAALGHHVTAVDQSAAMLGLMPDHPAIDTVEADIETLDIHRRFDAVVLGSHLLNTPDGLSAQFLGAAARHLGPGGLVVAEVYPPAMDWVASVGRRSVVGSVGITVVRAIVRGTRLDAAVAYDVDGRSWQQPFEADLLDETAIRARLTDGGFVFDRWLDESSGWFAARRRP